MNNIEEKVKIYRRELVRKQKEELAKTVFDEKKRTILAKWREEYRRIFTEAGLEMLRISESANRYCGDACCPHLPAVVVTTQIGDIAFWWRKRVSVIDWSESRTSKTAHELFPGCEDTNDASWVHCWNYEKVIERLKVVLAAADPPPVIVDEEA